MSLSVTLRHALPGFTLDLAFQAPVGVTALFGRSGAGKTSVVQAVAGLLRPDQGHITLQGRVLSDTKKGIHRPPQARRIGYVFQDARLFPHMTVRQNLDYGRRFAGRTVPGAEADRVIEMLGLGPLLTRRPARLSGGEKQRVAIGRALLSDPALILADEPLAALDAPRKSEILRYFERLRDEVALPILYVSHSTAEVARLATTIVALNEGRIDRQGPAAQVLGDPMFSPTGARSVGAVLSASVRAHHADGLSELEANGQPLFLPRVDAPPGQTLRVRIAAQDVLLACDPPSGISALNILPGTIEQIREEEGASAIVQLTTAAGPLLAQLTRRSVAALGLTVGHRCHAVIKTVSIAPEDIGGL